MSDIVSFARRKYPAMADDLEQEIALAALLAERSSASGYDQLSKVAYIRQKAKFAVIDAVRVKRHWVPVELEQMNEDHVGKHEAEPEHAFTLDSGDLSLLKVCARHGSARVARDLGLSAPTLSKRLKQVRDRVRNNLQKCGRI